MHQINSQTFKKKKIFFNRKKKLCERVKEKNLSGSSFCKTKRNNEPLPIPISIFSVHLIFYLTHLLAILLRLATPFVSEKDNNSSSFSLGPGDGWRGGGTHGVAALSSFLARIWGFAF